MTVFGGQRTRRAGAVMPAGLIGSTDQISVDRRALWDLSSLDRAADAVHRLRPT